MIERLILIYARTEPELRDLEEFLKKHFAAVVQGAPVQRNTRPPYNGGVRAYFTLVGEAEEDG